MLSCHLFKNAKNVFIPVGTYDVFIVIFVHATRMLFILVPSFVILYYFLLNIATLLWNFVGHVLWYFAPR